MEKNVCALENVYNKEIWELFKECHKNKKREKRMKILIRNNKTGKHYKIEIGGKVKVGDKIMRLNEHEYLYNGKFEYCEVVKILEAKKKRKKLDPYFKTTIEEVKGKPRGEENLKKIKFPCYCTHNAKTDGYSGLGMIITNLGMSVSPEYSLIDIGKQRSQLICVASSSSLKELIKIWDIEILKGELHLWKEVGE